MTQFIAGLVAIVIVSAVGSLIRLQGALERADGRELDGARVQAIARRRRVAGPARALSGRLHGSVHTSLVVRVLVSR